MKTIKYLFLFLFLFCSPVIRAQFPNPNLDSLFSIWNDPTTHDTSRLKAIQIIAFEGYRTSKPDSSFYYAQLQYDLAKEIGSKEQMANALITQGFSFYIRNDFEMARDYYRNSLAIYEEITDQVAS